MAWRASERRTPSALPVLGNAHIGLPKPPALCLELGYPPPSKSRAPVFVAADLCLHREGDANTGARLRSAISSQILRFTLFPH